MPGVIFWWDKCREDKCQEKFLVGQMPGVIFWSDICQEDKCLEAIFDRTNAWSQFLIGQMSGGQMPGGNF